MASGKLGAVQSDPDAAFVEWRRVLKPGGTLLIFDGNWARPMGAGRVAQAALKLLDRWLGDDGTHHAGMPERHEAIMAQLPFGDGLKPGGLLGELERAGFEDGKTILLSRIAAAPRWGASMRDRLRTMVYARLAIVARAR